MNTAERIKVLCVRCGNISEAELARRVGTTPQNFNNKMKRNNFSEKDLCAIAEALGCVYSSCFTLPNGDVVQ